MGSTIDLHHCSDHKHGACSQMSSKHSFGSVRSVQSDGMTVRLIISTALHSRVSLSFAVSRLTPSSDEPRLQAHSLSVEGARYLPYYNHAREDAAVFALVFTAYRAVLTQASRKGITGFRILLLLLSRPECLILARIRR